jgi:hypothetical protein
MMWACNGLCVASLRYGASHFGSRLTTTIPHAPDGRGEVIANPKAPRHYEIFLLLKNKQFEKL